VTIRSARDLSPHLLRLYRKNKERLDSGITVSHVAFVPGSLFRADAEF
jgi:hypothetical protein